MDSDNKSEQEFSKLKILADFLFYDEYQDKIAFPRFEKCMSIFFPEENQLNLAEVFKDIAGKKKKYITFPRLVKHYEELKQQPENFSEETKKFFDKMMNTIIKIGKEIILQKEDPNSVKFTSSSLKRLAMISKANILWKPKKGFRGLILEYDDVKKANLFDENETNLLSQEGLELGLLIDPEENKELISQMNFQDSHLIRDSISHIFGSFSDKQIEFFGFKARSGKTYFEGEPQGTTFLIGEPNKQFHFCRFRMCKDGEITDFKAHFRPTNHYNNNLDLALDQVEMNDPNENICEEDDLEDIEDEAELDKYILSAPVVEDEKKTDDKFNDLLRIAVKQYKKGFKDIEDEEKFTQNVGKLSLEMLMTGLKKQKEDKKDKKDKGDEDKKGKKFKFLINKANEEDEKKDKLRAKANEEIKEISEPILKEHLANKEYNKEEAPVLAKTISDEIVNKLNEEKKGPKYICTTAILQKGDCSYNFASDQLWNSKTDGVVKIKHDAGDFVCFSYIFHVAP